VTPDDKGFPEVILKLVGIGDSVTVSLSGVHQIDPGRESRRFSVHPDYIHLFDPASGMRLAG
jgi:sn-glycerol 3-phosphate transport system ATP-binding protein